jgi:hypothetical protein
LMRYCPVSKAFGKNTCELTESVQGSWSNRGISFSTAISAEEGVKILPQNAREVASRKRLGWLIVWGVNGENGPFRPKYGQIHFRALYKQKHPDC